MSDFEVMPVGTRAAMRETALLLRKLDGCACEVAAERLETLLKVPGVEGATVTVPEPHADLPK